MGGAEPTDYVGQTNGGSGGNWNRATCVTGTGDNHFTTEPEKDATYTESLTANYRMNTVDANPHSMAKKRKSIIFAKFADNFAADTTILLTIRHKASKAIF